MTELPAQEAAPLLKQYLLNGAWVGPYFDATKNSPLEAFELEALRLSMDWYVEALWQRDQSHPHFERNNATQRLA